MWNWLVAALIVIVVLGGYAIHLQRQLRRREQQRAHWREEVEVMVQERTDKISNSITVIAGAMLEDQMTLSECCIRLSSLLNQLGTVSTQERFASIHKAAEELDHIPILDEWKALKFKQRMRHMKEMERIETKYRDFVLASCSDLQKNGLEAAQKDGVGFYQP